MDELPAVVHTEDKERRNYAALAHLSTFAGYVMPLGNLIGPFVVWQLRSEDEYVTAHAKEALNFQITMTMVIAVSGVSSAFLIGLPFLLAALVVDLVYTIMATMAANEGRTFSYPFTLRIVH